MIVAQNITVLRGARQVLRDVSLRVEPGQVLGILGRNGAGKTTLLRALAGLQPVAAGEVLVEGQRLASLERRERARRIAYLEQGGAGAWPVQARDVVALGRLPHHAPFPFGARKFVAADEAAIDRALLATDAAAFAERSIDTLSSGERARVLLARALAGEPRALLADEPVAALDPGHQLGVMRMLRQQAGGGMAVAVVLHDLALAARFCDRLALLDGGALLASCAPDSVLTPQLLAQGFGITALSGVEDGERYVLPWREIGR